MSIPNDLIVNADDLGHGSSINRAILHCFKNQYINSTSLMTNTDGYKESVDIIHENPCITNIGIHVNLIRCKPLSDFKQSYYLDAGGEWDHNKTNKVFSYFNSTTKSEFLKEIYAQIDRALDDKIPISHLDSHLHIHNLPCFYGLFLEAAKHYKIKLRLAQTYNSGNYIKYSYRRYINNIIRKSKHSYSDYFVTVDSLFDNDHHLKDEPTGIKEIMLHPDFTPDGLLVDSFDDPSLQKWVQFLKQQP